MKHQNVRNRLIENTIRIIAENGFDKTTTKAIVSGTDINEAFIDEADVWMILNHILNVMLDFAVKVHNDHMSKEDSYSEHVFRVIYRSVEQYFKKEEVNNND